MSKVVLTREAILAATPKQQAAMHHLAESEHVVELNVCLGTFDLPKGYLSFRQDWKSGTHIYGGIGPEGGIST